MTSDENWSASPRRLQDIMETLRRHQPDLHRRYGLLSIGVFGSWVRGDCRLESDIDLLVELNDPSMSLIKFIALKNELSDLLGVEVDLVEKEVLKPALGKRILDEVVYV